MNDQGEKPVLSDAQKQRITETVAVMKQLQDVLERVMPEVEKEQIGSLAYDLADFGEFARVHQARIDEILKMRGIENRKRLAELLDDLLYGDTVELEMHIENVREYLGKITDALGK